MREQVRRQQPRRGEQQFGHHLAFSPPTTKKMSNPFSPSTDLPLPAKPSKAALRSGRVHYMFYIESIFSQGSRHGRPDRHYGEI
jgi:hypothetical protein